MKIAAVAAWSPISTPTIDGSLGTVTDSPAVPATMVLDEAGVLVWVWYGELDTGIAQELARTIAGLGAMAGVPSR